MPNVIVEQAFTAHLFGSGIESGIASVFSYEVPPGAMITVSVDVYFQIQGYTDRRPIRLIQTLQRRGNGPLIVMGARTVVEDRCFGTRDLSLVTNGNRIEVRAWSGEPDNILGEFRGVCLLPDEELPPDPPPSLADPIAAAASIRAAEDERILEVLHQQVPIPLEVEIPPIEWLARSKWDRL